MFIQNVNLVSLENIFLLLTELVIDYIGLLPNNYNIHII